MEASNVQISESATSRALLMPEILSTVFTWIHADTESEWKALRGDSYYYFCRDGMLMRCGLVNRLWWEESIPLLWAEYPFQKPYDSENGFLWGMSELAPGRAQFFANFVQMASIVTVEEKDAEEYDALLRGLVFPKLHMVTLIVETFGTHVPRVEKNVVKHLVIDPRHEVNPDVFALDKDEMDVFLDRVATAFPCLEEVEFDDCAVAHPGAIERFAKRLPRLKSSIEAVSRNIITDN